MRTKGAANWTPELEDELRVHWASGESASQIAAMMGRGLTRNSIIGKANRLKLKKRREARPSSAPRTPRRPRAARTSRELGTSIRLGNARKAGKVSLEEALLRVKSTPRVIVGSVWEALPDTTPISILMASDETCRWPIGDPLQPSFGYCGCPVDEGSVYCLEHRARATTNFKATAEDKRKLERMDRSRRIFA
jgi:GcrA cell cycle regulator